MNKPPETVNIDKVIPIPTLGQNFEKKVYPQLTVSTKSRVFGDKVPNGVESHAQDLTDDLRSEVKRASGTACYFCGFCARDNEIHNLNDNHRDVSPLNLRFVCRICHRWKHLGEVSVSQGSLAYVPGLSPQDVNHLQRTIAVAMVSDDEDVRKDAQALLAWLVSHQRYVAEAWTTHDQGVFAAAAQRANPDLLAKYSPVVFEGLALALNSQAMSQQARAWRTEGYGNYPISQWARVHHNIMNAPL